jgi:uncharacterized membrane protein
LDIFQEDPSLSKSTSSASTSLISNNILIALCLAWGIIAILFFLFFSAVPPGEERPLWYLNGITILETGAFLLATILCLRNWKSEQIVSGRSVWLWLGLGQLSYAVGNLFFYLWGNVWGKDPAVSPGDFFYLLCYIFLAIGMLQAVLPRRLNLDTRQWLTVALIGLLGVGIALFLNRQAFLGDSEKAAATSPAVFVAATVPIAQTPAPAPAPAPTEPAPTEPIPAAPTADQAPAWVIDLDARLEPFSQIVGLLYILGDCLLLVIAATLLVAFWGGRFSQSWKLIALAAFCLYVADMFFAFFVTQADYREGSLWEVFWTLSALFFGLGAVVENSVSERSRRTSRRRRA